MFEKDIQFNEWLLKPNSNELVGKNRTIKLDHKVMQLLVYFTQNSNKNLTKDEIIKAVWGDGFFSEEVLTVAVSTLRKALGDNPQNPKYIKTIPRFGYRMLSAASSPSTKKTKKNLLKFLEEKIGLRFLIVSFIAILFLVVSLVMFLADKHRH